MPIIQFYRMSINPWANETKLLWTLQKKIGPLCIFQLYQVPSLTKNASNHEKFSKHILYTIISNNIPYS